MHKVKLAIAAIVLAAPAAGQIQRRITVRYRDN